MISKIFNSALGGKTRMCDIVVKYNNDLNEMPMPKLSGQQLDLWFSLIAFTNENNKNSKANFFNFWNPNKRYIEIPINEFVKLCRMGKENWSRHFTDIYQEIEEFLDIILNYTVSYETKNAKYFFVCFEEAKWDKFEQTIRIRFQKRFYDMITKYDLGYTLYELGEFINLTSIYAKKLYVHLKQFRSKGRFIIKWDIFKTYMKIPDSYSTADINKQVLKQAIKELTAEQNLFDQKRIPFKNLKYQKLTKDLTPIKKQKPEYIEFTFDIPLIQIENKPKSFDDFKSKKMKRNGIFYRIIEIKNKQDGIEIWAFKIDNETNLEIIDPTCCFCFKDLDCALQEIEIIKECEDED